MPTDQFSVRDQTVVVTGSSSGIGRAIAERFAADGANVVVCSREQENVDPVAEAINEGNVGEFSGTPEGLTNDGATDVDAVPGSAIAVECDVRERDAVDALVEATVEEFGGVDTLVNNAGASFMAQFEDISENGWHTIVDSNLTGTYHCSQAAGEAMRGDGGGSIVNLSSVAGQQGSPYMSHYGAAKAGIINLTTTLAAEWSRHGIRVNCIAPGFVATPGVESQMGVSASDIDRTDVDRRVGTSQEIADVAQFLASPASSYVVGETVTAGGVPQVMESPET
ncbi:SDR family NAD(P)-dependent oxidoreductase [Halobium salinum]|uniref:SDR family NAD(P)-dependent oxidoreductase n=1 Tax=Halobium salinum TaxID=1364940 RepID=A0ABD5PDG4_9EURY|nr:SDR family oxidoreductase [Halobium salinum]